MTTEATITVEDALKELREMLPDQRVSITETRRLLVFPDITIEIKEEFDYVITVGKGLSAKRFTAATLSEAIAQVRAWKQENRG